MIHDENGDCIGYYLVTDTNMKPNTELKEYILGDELTEQELNAIKEKETKKWREFKNNGS